MSRSTLFTGKKLPYETIEGGKWLSKALDPASIRSDVLGLPDTHNGSVAVLNYQTQAEVSSVDTVKVGLGDAEYDSYDTDMFLYQHPILMGCAASFVSGTANPADGKLSISAGIVNYNADGHNITGYGPVTEIFLKFTGADDFSENKKFSPRFVNLFVNEQIPGRNYTDQQKQMFDFCQRYRMIYGGTQVIPSCSDQYNSGTIEACQQVFNAGIRVENRPNFADSPAGLISDARMNRSNLVYTQSQILCFETNDFPNSSDIVQNSNALMTRYRSGVWMPYKIVNPLQHDYLSAEDKKYVSAPFWICGAGVRVIHQTRNYGREDYLISHEGDWTQMKWDADSNRFVVPTAVDQDGNPVADAQTGYATDFLLKCTSYLGLNFYIVIRTPDLTCNSGTYLRLADETHANAGTGSYRVTAQTVGALNESGSVFKKAYDTIPSANLLQYQIRGTGENNFYYEASISDQAGAPFDHAEGRAKGAFFCMNRVSAAADPNGVRTKQGNVDDNAVMFPQHSCLGVVNFRSISTTAGMKLMLRMGTEITLTSGTIYSMFRHNSPVYDETAIKSYLRVSREMKDAFYGDAASDEGQEDFANMIRTLVWATPGDGYVTTQGAAYSGKIAIE